MDLKVKKVLTCGLAQRYLQLLSFLEFPELAIKLGFSSESLNIPAGVYNTQSCGIFIALII